MDTGGRLIAGSHIRNEFVCINADDITRRVTFISLLNFNRCCLSYIFIICTTRNRVISDQVQNCGAVGSGLKPNSLCRSLDMTLKLSIKLF